MPCMSCILLGVRCLWTVPIALAGWWTVAAVWAWGCSWPLSANWVGVQLMQSYSGLVVVAYECAVCFTPGMSSGSFPALVL